MSGPNPKSSSNNLRCKSIIFSIIEYPEWKCEEKLFAYQFIQLLDKIKTCDDEYKGKGLREMQEQYERFLGTERYHDIINDHEIFHEKHQQISLQAVQLYSPWTRKVLYSCLDLKSRLFFYIFSKH